MTAIGLDIGTTTISMNKIDQDSGEVMMSITKTNNSTLNKDNELQDPELIYEIVHTNLESLIDNQVSCIGITGQMHGILYINKEGIAVSPLYTWRYSQGDDIYNTISYAEYISSITKYKMATGYGCTTFFAHHVQNKIPSNAVSFCTIQDYIAMRLTNEKNPLMHFSNAASLGLFDIDEKKFDKEAFFALGLDTSYLPAVTNTCSILGYYKETIPVSVGIGDNQASYIGAVKDMENSVLLNIGTGSQLTFLAKEEIPVNEIEKRPCVDNKYIQVGTTLCGGSAFGVLEAFFRKTAEMVVGKPIKSAYPGMNNFLDVLLHDNDYVNQSGLVVSTQFKGTRQHPSTRGSIQNIDTKNLTPQNMIVGFLTGIVNELYELYALSEQHHSVLVGSGNGLGLNIYLQRIASKLFDVAIKIPEHKEQAAYGAALFALVCAGIYPNIMEAQKLIRYK